MLTKRSTEKELIDLGPSHYTHDEYIQCLKKLFLVNKLLGFFRSTVKILKKLSKDSTLLDIGCGGGLFILHLSDIFPSMQMVGVDISNVAIRDAGQSLQSFERKRKDVRVSFQLQESEDLDVVQNRYDIILATLVCHHINDEDLIIFLKKAQLASAKVVIINDLHRHFLAEWLYALVSPVLFRNRLITHDGLISIRRGFTRSEWQLLLKKAGIVNYQLKWRFPFRWELILSKESLEQFE